MTHLNILSYLSKFQKLLIYLFVLISLCSYSQERLTISDTIQKNSFDGLYKKFYKHLDIESEKYHSKNYAKAYLKKAENEKIEIYQSWGHYLLAVFYGEHNDKWLFHMDNAIEISKSLNDKNFPTVLFINKGVYYKKRGMFKEAIGNYLDGLEYAQKNINDYYLYMIKHNIAVLKRRLGKYDEAKKLLKECLLYEGNKLNKTKIDSLSYILTLSELITTYRYNKEIDSAKTLNQEKKGFLKKKETHYLYSLNYGIHAYYENKLSQSIETLTSIIPEFSKKSNREFYGNYHLIDLYLYIGKSYGKLSDTNKQISYYKKIDSIIDVSNYVNVRNREVYKELLNYYKSKNDLKNQLKYVNNLLYTDSILTANYKVISNKIQQDYDTPLLLSEKESLLEKIDGKNDDYKSLITILIFILISISTLFYYQFRKRKIYEKRFEKLIENESVVGESRPIKENLKRNGDIGISEKIVQDILTKLQSFESEKSYLNSKVTINSLAKEFDTNSKYLSKIINYHYKINFSQYLNNLRIEYVVDRIKKDNKFRNYTIKAIAEEAGYNNAQSFSTHFYKKTGLYPSFFLNNLKD